jgi:gamma-glutamyltranspeptidase
VLRPEPVVRDAPRGAPRNDPRRGGQASGSRFALATPHDLATEAGVRAFEEGGNALDASLAAAAMLTVVYPHQCSVGGDLFAVVAGPGGRLTALNGSGAAPRAIDPDGLRARGEVMPRVGPLSITVPGVVAGWEALAALGARLGLAAAVAPAAAAARDGVAIAPGLARAIRAPSAAEDEGMAAVFFPGGEALEEAETLRQPALAGTLTAVAEGGAEAFYRGEVGRRLAAGLQAAGSPIATEDFVLHETQELRPLGGRYRHSEVLTAPPSSQGLVLLQILSALELLEPSPDPLGEHAVVMAELFRLTSEDRARWLGDTRRRPVPLDELLGEDHIRDLARLARGATADSSDVEALPRAGRGERAGAPESTEDPTPPGDTVAVVAMDAEGNAVSLIQSVFEPFGAGILEPSTGLVLHNRGAGFSLDPNHPAALEGGVRPPHTLTPVLVLKPGGPVVAALGTMGGWGQPQILTQVLVRLLDLGEGPGPAVSAPRWVVAEREGGGETAVLAEPPAAAAIAKDLERAGVRTVELQKADDTTGHVQVVVVRDDRLVAGSDPRADGAAAAG